MSQEDRMSKMQQIRQSSNEQIKSNLNSDQQQKFEEMMSHQHGGMHRDPTLGSDDASATVAFMPHFRARASVMT